MKNSKTDKLLIECTKKFSRILLLSLLSFKAHANVTEIDCLYRNMVYEAGNENEQGQKAVGIVTINRAKKLGKTICSTVYQKGQFVWTKKTSLKTKPVHSSFNGIKEIAKELYEKYQLKDEIPNELGILKTAMYFSRGKTQGKMSIIKIGRHWFCSDTNLAKKKHKHQKHKLA